MSNGYVPDYIPEMSKRLGIPEDILSEIDFMLGSIEECNGEYMLPVLKELGMNPEGGWMLIESIPDADIITIYKRLFTNGGPLV